MADLLVIMVCFPSMLVYATLWEWSLEVLYFTPLCVQGLAVHVPVT